MKEFYEKSIQKIKELKAKTYRKRIQHTSI